jgi:hypothetical protein
MEDGSMTKDDREAMMPEMMMGMMCGGAGEGSPKVQDMMSKMMPGGSEHEMSQMPEMMLKKMMPHCIGMMLPKIDPDERGEAAATILSALIEQGSAGMSDGQMQSFRKTLEEVLIPSA